jgi:hypothetical protein
MESCSLLWRGYRADRRAGSVEAEELPCGLVAETLAKVGVERAGAGCGSTG